MNLVSISTVSEPQHTAELSPPQGALMLLDMDGTVTQVTDVFNRTATEQAFAPYNIQLSDDTYALARGRSREEGIRQILERSQVVVSDEEIANIADRKNGIARKMREVLTPESVPDADRETLRRLRDAGLKLALGTSSKNALEVVNRTRLMRYFDVIVTGYEANDKLQIWKKCLSYFSVEPQNAIVVEDAQVGIDAAKSLGVIHSIGVGSGRLKATLCVPSLGDLRIHLT